MDSDAALRGWYDPVFRNVCLVDFNPIFFAFENKNLQLQEQIN